MSISRLSHVDRPSPQRMHDMLMSLLLISLYWSHACPLFLTPITLLWFPLSSWSPSPLLFGMTPNYITPLPLLFSFLLHEIIYAHLSYMSFVDCIHFHLMGSFICSSFMLSTHSNFSRLPFLSISHLQLRCHPFVATFILNPYLFLHCFLSSLHLLLTTHALSTLTTLTSFFNAFYNLV